MGLEELNPDQKKIVDDFKTYNEQRRASGKPLGGRPDKEFGQLLKIAGLVLKDAGYSIKSIAKELKVHPATAAKMLRDKDVKVETKDLDKVREQFANHIAEIVLKMLSTANSSEYIYQLSRSKNPGLVQALSLLIEKLNLLTGKPSNVLEVRDVVGNALDKLKELEDLEATLTKAIQNKSPKSN